MSYTHRSGLRIVSTISKYSLFDLLKGTAYWIYQGVINAHGLPHVEFVHTNQYGQTFLILMWINETGINDGVFVYEKEEQMKCV